MGGIASKINGKKGGRPKGTMSQKSLDKMRVKAAMEQRILRATDGLINAQLSIAQGQTFLYKIEKEKIVGPKGGVTWRSLPPKLVESQSEIESYLENLVDKANGDIEDEYDRSATYYYLTTKEPANIAIDSLQNRVHGKPTEALKLTANVTFSLRELAARRRNIIKGHDENPLLEDETKDE